MKVKDILGVLLVTFLIVTGLAVCCEEDDDRVFIGWLILP